MGMILNQFGQKFLDGAAQRPNRPRYFNPSPQDFDLGVSDFDHGQLVARSRKLFSNTGTIRSAITQKAMYSVGAAWLPQSLTTDTAWKAQAEEFLTKWYRVAEVKGLDFQTVLYQISVAMDRDGDVFVLLTNEDYPQIQLIPGHRIGSTDAKTIVEKGAFKGKKITKGIITNDYGRAIGFRVLGENDSFRDIPAQDLLHIHDKDYFESVRGIPLFSHALNSFQDMEEAVRFEMTAMLINSSLAFVESNDLGGLDMDDPSVTFDDVGHRAPVETFEDGTIKYFRAGSNSKIEPVINSRPGPEWRAFHDRLTRAALQGANWPVNLLDAMQGSTGVESRIALKIAEQSVKDRQNVLFPIAQRIVAWVIAKAIKQGLLPASEDFYKWSFSKPPYLSIDAGRDATALREAYKLGLINLTQICESEGRTLDQHQNERLAEEIAWAKKKAAAELPFIFNYNQ